MAVILCREQSGAPSCPKPQSGGKRANLVLTPLELIERIAALVPPSRTL